MGGIFSGGNSSAQGQVPAAATAMQVQSSVYGAAIQVAYGATRVAGNLIWYGDFTATPATQTVQGGKGGGGSQNVQTGWTYSASFMLALSEGPIYGINDMWNGATKQYVGALTRTTFVPGGKLWVPITTQIFDVAPGSSDQTPWSWLSSVHPDQALSYRNTSIVASSNYDLQTSTTLPNFNWEILGVGFQEVSGISDAVPTTIITDILTNTRYGAGYPAAKCGDWTQYRRYCIAAGLFISPAYSDNGTQAQQAITDIIGLTNAGIYFSEGLLKIVPYADQAISGNGVTFIPSTTPIYALTDEDFIVSEGDDPITVTRGAISDAYNSVKIEYRDRSHDYNSATVTAQDQAGIDTYGLRQASITQAHQICDSAVAQTAAQLKLQYGLYIRNQYAFRLGASFCLLEPTDYVTLTDSRLGISSHPVRIITIEEQDGDEYQITAEDAPAGVSSHAVYDSQQTAGFAMNLNVDPDPTLAPVIIEPPYDLTGSGLEIWIAACGGPYWGGCEVWVSYDGASYQQIGRITQPSRIGVLTSALSAGTDPDTENTLSVSMSQSRAQLISASASDWNQGANLCVIDNEFLSFRDALLTGPYAYNLTTLHRGVYRTSAVSHASGARFIRLDQAAVLRYPISAEKIGSTVFVKLPAINIFGSRMQQIDEVSPFSYTITGAPPPPPVTGLEVVEKSDAYNISWSYPDPLLGIEYFEVQYSTGAGWIVDGTTKAKSYLLTIKSSGVTHIQVCAVNTLGMKSEFVSVSITTSLPTINGLTTYYQNGNTYLGWYRCETSRGAVRYEIRKGDSWTNGLTYIVTTDTKVLADSNARYMVRAVYTTAYGVDIYSEADDSITIDEARLSANVIATFEDSATGWTGTKSTDCIVYDNEITLADATGIDSITDFDSVFPFDWYGGIAAYGRYETSNTITLASQQLCHCSIDITAFAVNEGFRWDDITDLDSVTNLDGYVERDFEIIPLISISTDGTTWGEFKRFYAGDYYAKAFRFAVDLYSYSMMIRPVVSQYTYSVDMDDRIEKGTSASVGTPGLTITYSKPFQVTPNTQITIINAIAGDDAKLTSASASGFTVLVYNGGATVARSINWISQGY